MGTDFAAKINERSSINVVVIGDAGVGKSSLISSFISRHFSETVPGLMARIRVPVEVTSSARHGGSNKGCVTTIIDTQEGDIVVEDSESLCGVAAKKMDAVVLVYDLKKIETFYRMESHWLPLIEKLGIPVVLAGNKMDLEETDEQSQARSRHQIVSLLQQFKFVRQCIKCSAKNVWNVNDVFLKAQQAVLYPINPLYDLSEGKLTVDCERALTRIFRIFDVDRDNLLSDEEMKIFQRHCFNAPLIDRDLAAWKKLLSKNNPSEAILQEGMFTVLGFLAIFDTYINSDRIEIPWIVLRSFGYDNDLSLNVPSFPSTSWSLSSSEILFLISTFHQFDSNHDGILSSQNISSIFSIITHTKRIPPWNPLRAEQLLKTCSSQPALHFSSSTTALSLDQWINRWYMLSAISPSASRAEMYRLGHAPSLSKTSKTKHRKSKVASINPDIKHYSSKVIRLAVIGSSESGKSTLLNALYGHEASSSSSYSNTTKAQSTCALLDFKVKGNHSHQDPRDTFIHYIFTEIPVQDAANQLLLVSSSGYINDASENQGFDLILFLFDSSNSSSLEFVLDLENKYLKDDIPRMFIAVNNVNKIYSVPSTTISVSDSTASSDSPENYTYIHAAIQHCTQLDLESPCVISLNSLDKTQFLQHIGRFVLDDNDPHHFRTKPFAERKRREDATRRTIMWIGGFVAAAAVVVASVVMLWNKGPRNRITNGVKTGK